MDYKKNLWTAVLVLLVGITLVFFYNTAATTIVMILGGMFVLAAVLNIGMQLGKTKPTKDDKKGSSIIGLLTAIASGALGLWMLIAPSSLVHLLIYIFAAVVILAGIYQICTLALSYSPIRFPMGFYILPSLLVVCGIVIFIMGPQAIADWLTMIIGIGMIVYAISMFIEIGGVAAFRKSLKNGKAIEYTEPDGNGGTIDVKAEEVVKKE